MSKYASPEAWLLKKGYRWLRKHAPPIWADKRAPERFLYGKYLKKAAGAAWKVGKGIGKSIYNVGSGFGENPYQRMRVFPNKGKRGRPQSKNMPNKRRRSKKPKYSASKKRRATNVTTYSGSSRVTPGRVRRKLPYNTAGAVIHFEKAGVINQNGNHDLPAVVGHSTWYYRYLMDALCLGIVRRLLRQSGVHVHNFYEEIAREEVTETVSAGSLRYAYSLEETNDPTVVTLAIGTESNVRNLADVLRISFESLLNATTDNAYRLKLYFIELVGADVDSLRASRLSGGDTMVHFMSTSHLRVQNRTLASSTAGDENAESMLHVTNNPLVGRVYDHLSNGLSLKALGDFNGGGNVQGFGPDPTTGLIAPDLTTFATNDQNRMLHPPSAHLFIGRVKQGRLRVTPGEIKHSTLKTVKSMPLNSYMYFMFNLLKGRSETVGLPYIKQGACRVMMLEKQMDTDSADEPEISLGYELNNTVGLYLTTKPAYCDALQFRL